MNEVTVTRQPKKPEYVVGTYWQNDESDNVYLLAFAYSDYYQLIDIAVGEFWQKPTKTAREQFDDHRTWTKLKPGTVIEIEIDMIRKTE